MFAGLDFGSVADAGGSVTRASDRRGGRPQAIENDSGKEVMGERIGTCTT